MTTPVPKVSQFGSSPMVAGQSDPRVFAQSVQRAAGSAANSPGGPASPLNQQQQQNALMKRKYNDDMLRMQQQRMAAQQQNKVGYQNHVAGAAGQRQDMVNQFASALDQNQAGNRMRDLAPGQRPPGLPPQPQYLPQQQYIPQQHNFNNEFDPSQASSLQNALQQRQQGQLASQQDPNYQSNVMKLALSNLMKQYQGGQQGGQQVQAY